ncbi:hypothetical protein SBD_1687 [Streptomyces bottropensis ATCC 25435]|uniref:Uncharacterized protein n=1 Tax=Streptomyces bottropensis ATCC 25435 TaxID=1054862 RepID=M3EKE2_9ACTN|nr:hypothetical protein SBD_1687 [Streptomyces bottropensis ATCC 25435]
MGLLAQFPAPLKSRRLRPTAFHPAAPALGARAPALGARAPSLVARAPALGARVPTPAP